MWYLRLSLIKDPLGPVNRGCLPIKGRGKEKQEPIKTPPGGTHILLCSSHADNMLSQPGEWITGVFVLSFAAFAAPWCVCATPVTPWKVSWMLCVFPAAAGGGLRWRRAPQGEQSSGGDHRPPAVCHSSLHSGRVQVEQRHTMCPHVLWSTE